MEIVEKPEKLTKDLVAYNKAYRAEHKDYYKKYYETNKAVILEAMLKKVPCSCGCEIQQCNLNKHLQTPIHEKRLIKLQFEDFLKNQDSLGKNSFKINIIKQTTLEKYYLIIVYGKTNEPRRYE